ncbi:MAG: hypothetical protein SPJ69_01075 [Campylobacter sp.]|uniref:hypothetical protein n=1 Tax=Campylobacter sp. TaxID=205 RepID=UPI0029774434|nr:hypothetical protein [Campylobacter sp.]MDD6925733.1 hypothetical protein [Campylobacteraceae bacterium]MDD7600955.1 hypothetical protein [Campylobacteraceae bacterium]MDY5886891.1 hypothetical protein [Campylobacter sp.]
MQKPKSLEQIANELAAKREPIKMEPKPKNTGGIDLSRAAGVIKEQPKQNLAQKSRIPSQSKAQSNSRIPNQNLAQKPRLNSEQNARNSRIPSASQPQSTQKSRIPSQSKAQSNSRIPNQNLAQKPRLNSEQNARNSRIPNQNLAQKIEPKPEPKPEKIVIKPKIATFRDDISELYETPAQNLSKTSLFIAFGIAFLVMIATLPKIFIANEIYYTSRDIGTLRDKLGVLNEENRELKSKLEQIRYQNQIIDNLR